MVSDFRKKKLLHVFNVFFDTDASGTVEKGDFDGAVQRFAKIKGLGAGDAKYKEIQDYLTKIWTGLQSQADADKDGQVSKEEWISMWDNFAKDPASASEWQNLYAKFVFAVEDSGNDGSIDSEEFASTYAGFGLDKGEALTAFKNLKAGNHITWAEFEPLFKEYFTSEDVNAPGNNLFGKTSY